MEEKQTSESLNEFIEASKLEFINFDIIKEKIQSFKQKDSFKGLKEYFYSIWSSSALLKNSFIQTEPQLREYCPIDTNQVIKTYNYIKEECTKESSDGVLFGLSSLLEKYSGKAHTMTDGDMNVLMIIAMNPILMDPTNGLLLMPQISQIITALQQDKLDTFLKYLVAPRCVEQLVNKTETDRIYKLPPHITPEEFTRIVNYFQQFITVRTLTKHQEINLNKDESIIAGTKCLNLLYKINEKYKLVPYTEFYNDEINEQLEIKEDYPCWKAKEFSFCSYPFILNPLTKSDILKVESMVSMRHELQDAFFSAMFSGITSPYLVLEVRRDHLIRDVLYGLEDQSPHDLKKQLRVQFIGEEGIDEGGVQKEFFQLCIKELFDPMYGMFKFNDESNLCWFTNDPAKDNTMFLEYKLIGRLIGVAIYNSVILDLHFPLALYKKLRGIKVDLEDIKELDPMLYVGLRKTLTDENVESYEQSFQIQIDNNYGGSVTVDLKPNGENIKLKKENREEFVDLYVDYLLNSSISKQFNAFKEGFDSVVEGSAIEIFRPEELEQLVCGSQDIDIDVLESVTLYDGFTKESECVKNFWSIVHEFDEIQKKRLLFFTTGTDRVPLGGTSKMQFIIARNGPDSDRLPSAHTCFSVLLLNDYATREKLKERLLTALKNADCGFFLG
ncbi:HECT-domain-containing protein [Piromyces finnis]|uniref:HECT-type E3 ubiquitin transferase n=1 Tax=Piromyces finnis TaxID=1754191 RepID=A0A1Y1V9Y2_9FUNG|nr:HECT-domain-containing protein [Piromyces finnis]|eukprot:ORX50733.1 HECT-domain-containing protein [Piromyces finnis]